MHPMDADVPSTVSEVTLYQNHKIKSNWVKLIFVALKKQGLPAEDIFKDVGICTDYIENISSVSQNEVIKLYQQIELYGELNQLPFYVGEVFQLHFIGLAKKSLEEVKTLNDLLENMVTITSNITYLGKSKIEVNAEHTSISFSSSTLDYKLHYISLEIAVFVACGIIEQVFPHLTGIISNVVLDKASRHSLVVNKFDYPVIYSDDGIYRVIVSSNALVTKNIFSRSEQIASLEKYQAIPRDDIRDYTVLEDIIVKNLNVHGFSVFNAADMMNVSVKTLQRKLLKFNVNFSLMVHNTKLRRAIFLLKENELSIKQISFELGFLSPSSFSRAFKSWTGYSPSNYIEST